MKHHRGEIHRAEISHRLIAGENKEQLEVTENKILDVTGQHMSAWEAESKSPEQLRGTNGKLFQNILYILYNGNTNGYPMLSNGNYPTSVYPDNIYPDLESANSIFVVPNESNGFGTSK